MNFSPFEIFSTTYRDLLPLKDIFADSGRSNVGVPIEEKIDCKSFFKEGSLDRSIEKLESTEKLSPGILKCFSINEAPNAQAE